MTELFPTHLPANPSAVLGASAINLTGIRKTLVQTEAEAVGLLNSLPPDAVGFDTEGTSLQHPDAQMVGMSFYNRADQHAFYIPLAHNEGLQTKNIPWTPTLAEATQAAFLRITPTMHNGGYDQPFFTRRGLKFRQTIDTYILANLLQEQQAGLKDLVLEYGLVSFKDVISYKRLIQTCLGISDDVLAKLTKDQNLNDVWSFAQIDVAASPIALDYVCNDSIFVLHLNEVLEQDYIERVGNEEQAREILRVQYNSARYLHEKSSPGFLVEATKLHQFINQYSTEVDQQEKDLREQIRTAMGWAGAPVTPSLFDALNGAA